MKALILFAVAALASTQVLAASVTCRSKESDLQCANRVILKSNVLTQAYYTGSVKEWPMLYPAIFAKKPSAVQVISRSGEGDSILSEYMFSYKVSASDISGLQTAVFTVTVEQQVEDTGASSPKVVSRSIDLSTLKIVAGYAGDEN